AAEADTELTPITTTTIDPVAQGIIDGGHYTALLSGLIDGSAATLTAIGARPCFDVDGTTPITCATPSLRVLADSLETDAELNTVRFVNAMANGGAVELC